VVDFAARVAPTLMEAGNRYGDMWDLDEIFWKTYPAPWDVERALRAFRLLVASYGEWASRLVAILTINLTQSTVLDSRTPDLSAPVSLDVSSFQPPALGFGKRLRPALITYEHYRVPLAQELVTVESGEVRAYYECWRTSEAMGLGEPYSRAVMLQHWASENLGS